MCFCTEYFLNYNLAKVGPFLLFYKFPWIVCPRVGVSYNAAAWLSLPAGAVGILVEAFATNIKCGGALQGSTFWGTSGHPKCGRASAWR